MRQPAKSGNHVFRILKRAAAGSASGSLRPLARAILLNPNRPRLASHCKGMKIKTTLLTWLFSTALALGALGQDPTASPLTPTPSAPPAAIVPAPAAAVATTTPQPSATAVEETALERKIKDKVKRNVQV